MSLLGCYWNGWIGVLRDEKMPLVPFAGVNFRYEPVLYCLIFRNLCVMDYIGAMNARGVRAQPAVDGSGRAGISGVRHGA